ncbi:hypothetical protein KCU69_g17, partial [Aureobasidium melanogenum]
MQQSFNLIAADARKAPEWFAGFYTYIVPPGSPPSRRDGRAGVGWEKGRGMPRLHMKAWQSCVQLGVIIEYWIGSRPWTLLAKGQPQ